MFVLFFHEVMTTLTSSISVEHEHRGSVSFSVDFCVHLGQSVRCRHCREGLLEEVQCVLLTQCYDAVGCESSTLPTGNVLN